MLRPERLVRLFRSTGASGRFVKPVSELPSDQQDVLNAYIGTPRVNEYPVIACYRNTDNWTLLTTRRIAWCRGGEARELPIQSVCEATLPDDIMHSLTPSSKSHNDLLQLVVSDGSTYLVQLESGRPFAGFWNVMKLLIAIDWQKESPEEIIPKPSSQ